MTGRVKMREQRWRIVGVYVRENIKEILRKLQRWVKRERKGSIIDDRRRFQCKNRRGGK